MGSWFSECVVCSAAGAGLCGDCAARLEPAAAVPGIAGVSTIRALFAYAGVGRDVIAALKYKNRRAAYAELGAALAQLVPPEVDLITWLPTTRARRRERGYDQAELLARRVARSAGIPCRPTLRRSSTIHQTGQGREQRLQGPDFVPYRRFATQNSVVNASVLVVDDVITTGSTVRTAAATLHREGVDDVHAVALAFTSQPV